MGDPNLGRMEFDFEFYSKDFEVRDEVREETEDRLRNLATKRADMTGASVTIEQDGHKTDEPYVARIMAYVKPKNVQAFDRGKTPEQALGRAVQDIERQVREGREKRAAKGGRATAD